MATAIMEDSSREQPAVHGWTEGPPGRSWHFRARSVAALTLLLAAVLAGFWDLVPSVAPLVVVAFAIGAYNLALWFLSRRETWKRRVPGLALFFDLFALTVFLHYSGDIENPLRFGYLIPVVTGAVLVSKRLGLLLAATAVGLFCTLLALTLVDSLPIRLEHNHLALIESFDLHHKIDPASGPVGTGYILTHTAILVVLLFGSAFGFGTLVDRMRRGEEQLRQEHERVLLLLDLLPESVVLMSGDGRILVKNPAAREGLRGRSEVTIAALEAELGIQGKLASLCGKLGPIEATWNGRILSHAFARRSATGPLVWVFRDLTEQRRMMAQVMHVSKMADLGLLAAGIAHEIGNPLSSMSVIVELMEMNNGSPEVSSRVQALNNHIMRISRIVRDVNSFARPSAEKKTRTTAGTIFKRAAEIFRFHEKSKSVALEVSQAKSDPAVEVVEDQMVQVFLNLLLNGADAMKGTGTIRVNFRSDNGAVRVSVADKGCGIPHEERQRLFTPFYTTKDQGSGVGLGLFVSESIVRGHGGRIEVDSEPEKGSTFTVCLPRPGGPK